MKRLLPWLGAAACFALAAWARLRWLDLAIPDRDAIAPFASAWALLDGRLPSPHQPHFGDGLWLSCLPLVVLARSLWQLFVLRFLVSASVAATGFGAAWLLAEGATWRRLCAGLAAGVFLAWDPGLMDTVISGARGYWAPELIGLATLGAAGAARGKGWGLPLLLGGWLLAAHHHPLALGAGVGLLLFARPGWKAAGRRWRISGAVVALGLVGLALVRLLVTRQLQDEGLLSVARDSASASPLEGLPLAGEALWNLAWADHGAGWWILALGLLLALPGRAAWAALIGLLAALVLGLLIHHLDFHHLRMAMAPIAVAAALGWARLGPAPIVAAGLAIGLWHVPDYMGLPQGALRTLDTMAPVVAAQPGPAWLDRMGRGGGGCMESTGLVLAMVLQGHDTDHLVADPSGSMVLALCGEPPAEAVVLWRQGRESLLRFDSVDAARAWALTLGRVDAGDAADWAAMLGWGQQLHLALRALGHEPHLPPAAGLGFQPDHAHGHRHGQRRGALGDGRSLLARRRDRPDPQPPLPLPGSRQLRLLRPGHDRPCLERPDRDLLGGLRVRVRAGCGSRRGGTAAGLRG